MSRRGILRLIRVFVQLGSAYLRDLTGEMHSVFAFLAVEEFLSLAKVIPDF
jgi:hypothetical protein